MISFLKSASVFTELIAYIVKGIGTSSEQCVVSSVLMCDFAIFSLYAFERVEKHEQRY